MIDLIENVFGVRVWWPFTLSLLVAGAAYAAFDKLLYLEPTLARFFARLAESEARPIDTFIELLNKILSWMSWFLGVGEYRTSEFQIVNVFLVSLRFLALSLGYTTALFLLSWLISGSGNLGSLTILPDNVPFWERFLVVSVLCLATLGGLVGIIYHELIRTTYSETYFGQILSLNFFCATIASLGVGIVVLVTTDKIPISMTLFDYPVIYYLVFIATVLTFIGVYSVIWCFMALSIALGSAFCLLVGVPVVVGVPLVLAIIIFDLGHRPALIAAILVPSCTFVFAPLLDISRLQDAAIMSGLLCLPFAIMVFSAHFHPRRGERGKPLLYAFVLSTCAFVSVTAVVALNTSQMNQGYVDSVGILWLFFPIVNGFWDMISVFVTFLLISDLTRGLTKFAGQNQIVNNSAAAHPISSFLWTIFSFVWHFIFDLGFAFLVLGLLVLTLALGTSALETLNQFVLGVPVFDSYDLVTSFLGTRTSADGLFVVLLLTSTVVPTCVHLITILLSIFIVSFTPRPVIEGLKVLQSDKTDGDEFLRSRASYRVAAFFSFGIFASSLLSLGLIDYLVFALFDKGLLNFFSGFI